MRPVDEHARLRRLRGGRARLVARSRQRPVRRPLRHLGRTLERRLRGLPGRLPAAAFVEDQHAARRLLARGERALAASALEEAESLAIEALAVAPGLLRSLQLLARVLDARGQVDDALACHRGRVPETLWERHFGAVPMPCGSPAPLEREPVHAAERHEMPPPRGVAEPAPDVFRRGAVVATPTFVDRVPGGRVWQDAHDTLVLDGGGHALDEHTLGNPHVVRHLIDRHEPMHLGARAFVLGARGSGNYYHWMTDILPKLELCRLAGYHFGERDRFVLPTRRSAFQLDSLALLGIRARQVHFSSLASPYVTAEELVVPFLSNTMATTMGAWLPEFLKRTFLPPGERPEATRRLFASRHPERSQGRSITNIEQVEAYFASRGFEIVFPETLSLQGQARLFAEAAVVAAPHGAGLANIVFCAPGTRIIEFYGAHLAPCYRAISTLAGLDYHAHFCLEGADEQDEHARARSLDARRTAGFAIDVGAAGALLDLAGVD